MFDKQKLHAKSNIFLILCLGGFLIVFAIYPLQYGYNSKSARNKFYKAKQDGDGEQAVYWAQKSFLYTRGDKTLSYAYLAEAYELNGDFEKAIEYYHLAYGTKNKNVIANIYYKQNKKQKAFQTYCEFTLKFNAEGPYRKKLYRELILRNPYPKLSAFATYYDYVRFMEEEYEKLDSSADFQKAMEKLRNI